MQKLAFSGVKAYLGASFAGTQRFACGPGNIPDALHEKCWAATHLT
jgi:hypothetical protein